MIIERQKKIKLKLTLAEIKIFKNVFIHLSQELRHNTKEVIHVISFEPISQRPTSKSSHEPSVKSVRKDVIGTFWRATSRELSHELFYRCPQIRVRR